MVTIFYLYLSNSTLTDEKICVGLLAFIDDEEAILKVSNRKLQVAHDIVKNKNAYDLFKSYINGISNNLQTATKEYMEKQSRYQNGIVKISSPSTVSIEDGAGYVNNIFTKHIE